MWEPVPSSPTNWNSMSCTTVPESPSSLESPECGRSAAEATSQTLKRSSAWIQNAVDAALNLYDLLHGKGDLEAWKKMQKKSLCSGFNDADSSAIIAWNKRMQELVRMDEIAKDIRYGKPVKETAALEPLTQLQENWLERRLKRADFSETVRLNYYIGTALGRIRLVE